ncbi:MAG: choice-of-anchor L domain-containing protein [Flavobacteriales bacterium]|nr:choice-of-anchor L domain-containing protein [Flavobacteriales bacterium]
MTNRFSEMSSWKEPCLYALFFLLATCYGSQHVIAQCSENVLSLEIYDSWGDGWDGATYTIYDANTVPLYTGTLLTGAIDLVDLCLPNGCYELNVTPGLFPNEVSWSLSGSDAGVITGVPGTVFFSINEPACNGGVSCDEPYTLIAGGGYYEYEISWNLSNDDGLITSGFASSGTQVCLEPGCHYLELFDSFGDGWNDAVWTLLDFNGQVIGTGTMFTGAYELVVISIGGAECDIPEPPDVIQVESGVLTPEQLITDVFLGDCLSASNIQYTGDLASIGTFSNGSSIGIEEGIILSSGFAVDAMGPNTSGSTGSGMYTAGLDLLDVIADNLTTDAAIFQFDFVAQTDGVTFTYVFASDEYPEFVCSTVNDAFGFFVSGPGYAPNTNIATIPGTTDPVTINNVNNNGDLCPPFYGAYYNDNITGVAHEFDGYTTPLTASIVTEACATYQIIIAVADAGDNIYDSAVFLEAESFTAGLDVGVTAAASLGQSNPGNCEENGYFFFVNNGEDFSEEVTLTYTVSGTAVDGGLIESIPSSITFQPGESALQLPVTSIAGALGLNPESVTITIDPNQGCSCNTEVLESTLYLCSSLMLPVEWLSFEANYRALHDEVLCEWSTASEQQSTYFVLEHSQDFVNWEKIALIDAAGTSNETKHYAFKHEHPEAGDLYYRIKQVDQNGDYSYSETRHTLKLKTEPSFSLYPNPNDGRFMLEKSPESTLLIYNTLGQLIPYEWSTNGEVSLTYPVPGNYIVELKSAEGETLERLRLMVQ